MICTKCGLAIEKGQKVVMIETLKNGIWMPEKTEYYHQACEPEESK